MGFTGSRPRALELARLGERAGNVRLPAESFLEQRPRPLRLDVAYNNMSDEAIDALGAAVRAARANEKKAKAAAAASEGDAES